MLAFLTSFLILSTCYDVALGFNTQSRRGSVSTQTAQDDMQPRTASVGTQANESVNMSTQTDQDDQTLLNDNDDVEDPPEDAGGVDPGILCRVEAKRPYSRSPKVFLKNITVPYNAALVGYDTHRFGRRSDKGSLYGWSSGKRPNDEGTSSFTFDLDYAIILPQAGTPLSYCALIFSPPIAPKFDISKIFGKPSLALSRYIGSELHLAKALKKRGKVITSCCFTAFPMNAY